MPGEHGYPAPYGPMPMPMYPPPYGHMGYPPHMMYPPHSMPPSWAYPYPGYMPPYYPPGYHPFIYPCPQCQAGPRNERVDNFHQKHHAEAATAKKQLNFESPDPPKKTTDANPDNLN